MRIYHESDQVDWLIRAIDERDAIIHDLTLDGSALARRAVEEFAAELVDRLAVIARDVAKRTSATNYGKWLGVQDAINLVSALTKVGTIDPLPPDRVRQENERLRQQIDELLSGCGSNSCKVQRPHGQGVDGPCKCVEKLRAGKGEEEVTR